jgi:ubiquinone/menaquinone biosynthesis C-methylase UbiE
VFKKLIYDHTSSKSLATKLRLKRFTLLKSLFAELPNSATIRILDVGGTQNFWDKSVVLSELGDVEITIMNISEFKVNAPNIRSIVGDARNMKQFADKEFDVVFSNSVIEHVGSYEDQRQMAKEIKRVGKRYFVQTPNLYFPIEPHFVFPFFQFLPQSVKVWLISHFALGWYGKVTDIEKANELASEIRLLSKKEFINLFANAKIVEEKFLGLTKSFIAYEGW